MNPRLLSCVDSLTAGQGLPLEDFAYLIENRTPQLAQLLAAQAVRARRGVYGIAVYVRGLVEISNICKNDCLYCGIRASNSKCQRYRLGPEEIFSCVEEGYRLGFRTFVLQGGEDAYYTDEILVGIIRGIKEKCPGCAVTLSLGERSRESYRILKEAGADRYLLRHETADKAHYESLHPAAMSFENRMACLQSLRELGYQVGCGFMVGSPGQTAQTLAKDLKFIGDFKPDMCGIGPFVPHTDTAFAKEPPGTVELTCFLLSIIRLLHPAVLLPATTALGTIHPRGRELGILSGANVVMPNLSPEDAKSKYELYDNKLNTGAEAAQGLAALGRRMARIGYEVSMGRGDVKKDGRHGRV